MTVVGSTPHYTTFLYQERLGAGINFLVCLGVGILSFNCYYHDNSHILITLNSGLELQCLHLVTVSLIYFSLSLFFC